jgi:hypothetical protein
LGEQTPSSFSSICIHITLAVAFAKALYSASVLNLNTVGCFLALHKTRLGPIKIANPHVDLRSFGQPAQLVSAKTLTIVEMNLMNFTPIFNITYQRILLTASQ